MKVFQLNITVKKESNFSAITMSVEWWEHFTMLTLICHQ
jgi:hypothetical protein